MQKRESTFQHFLHSCPFSQLDFLLKQNGLNKCVMLDKTMQSYDWEPALHKQGDVGAPMVVSEHKGRASSLLTGCGGKVSGLGKWLQEQLEGGEGAGLGLE